MRGLILSSDKTPASRLSCLVAACLYVSTASSTPSRGAIPLPAGHEQRVASCISTAAAGRQWLEHTLWGLRDQEGGWEGAEVRNTDGSSDLGPLQINSQWVVRLAALTRRPDVQIHAALAHDTCFNVRVASWLFLTALSQAGDYWSAVGMYHSPDPRHGRPYAQSVARKMISRFGGTVFARGASPSLRTGVTRDPANDPASSTQKE